MSSGTALQLHRRRRLQLLVGLSEGVNDVLIALLALSQHLAQLNEDDEIDPEQFRKAAAELARLRDEADRAAKAPGLRLLRSYEIARCPRQSERLHFRVNAFTSE